MIEANRVDRGKQGPTWIRKACMAWGVTMRRQVNDHGVFTLTRSVLLGKVGRCEAHAQVVQAGPGWAVSWSVDGRTGSHSFSPSISQTTAWESEADALTQAVIQVERIISSRLTERDLSKIERAEFTRLLGAVTEQARGFDGSLPTLLDAGRKR